MNTRTQIRLFLSQLKINKKDLMHLSAFRLTEMIRYLLALGKLADSSLDRRSEFSGDTFTKTSALRDTGNAISRGKLCPCICYIKIYSSGFNETRSRYSLSSGGNKVGHANVRCAQGTCNLMFQTKYRLEFVHSVRLRLRVDVSSSFAEQFVKRFSFKKY